MTETVATDTAVVGDPIPVVPVDPSPGLNIITPPAAEPVVASTTTEKPTFEQRLEQIEKSLASIIKTVLVKADADAHKHALSFYEKFKHFLGDS